MIKWMLTTLILVVTVAVVTVAYLVPTLRDKSQNLVKAQTEMVRSRLADIKEILDNKQALKNILDKPQDKHLEEPVKTVAAEKRATPAKTSPKAGTKPQVKPAPKPAEGSTAKIIPDQIPDSDRQKLEEVLEKANK